MTMSTDEHPPNLGPEHPTYYRFPALCLCYPFLIQVPLQKNMDLTRCPICSLGAGSKTRGFWNSPWSFLLRSPNPSRACGFLSPCLSIPKIEFTFLYIWHALWRLNLVYLPRYPNQRPCLAPTSLPPESQHLLLRPGRLGPWSHSFLQPHFRSVIFPETWVCTWGP